LPRTSFSTSFHPHHSVSHTQTHPPPISTPFPYTTLFRSLFTQFAAVHAHRPYFSPRIFAPQKRNFFPVWRHARQLAVVRQFLWRAPQQRNLPESRPLFRARHRRRQNVALIRKPACRRHFKFRRQRQLMNLPARRILY